VRTPLTSLRMEADSLADPAEAARVAAGVDAVNRAVTDVIQLARRRGAAPDFADAAEIVRERVAFWAVLAEDTERSVTVDIAPGPLPVALARADLEACVDALLGNVFAHTPHGTAFRVALSFTAAGAVLTVEDAGPGLPDDDVVRRGVSGAGSSGLGLDIVRRAAERTGGSVRLDRSELGGLRVVVEVLGPR
jgi:signal transduction histidine kinase